MWRNFSFYERTYYFTSLQLEDKIKNLFIIRMDFVWISCQYKRSDCHFMLTKFSCSQVAVMARMSSIIVWMWICQQQYDSLNVSITAAGVLFSVCRSNFYRSRQLHVAVQIRAYKVTSLGSCHISLNIIAKCMCIIGHVVQFTLMD